VFVLKKSTCLTKSNLPNLQIWKAVYMQGMGRHTPTEVDGILMGDLQALSTMLGSHNYFFGSKPTTVGGETGNHHGTNWPYMCKSFLCRLMRRRSGISARSTTRRC
jgi:hypothetical protein